LLGGAGGGQGGGGAPRGKRRPIFGVDCFFRGRRGPRFPAGAGQGGRAGRRLARPPKGLGTLRGRRGGRDRWRKTRFWGWRARSFLPPRPKKKKTNGAGWADRPSRPPPGPPKQGSRFLCRGEKTKKGGGGRGPGGGEVVFCLIFFDFPGRSGLLSPGEWLGWGPNFPQTPPPKKAKKKPPARGERGGKRIFGGKGGKTKKQGRRAARKQRGGGRGGGGLCFLSGRARAIFDKGGGARNFWNSRGGLACLAHWFLRA